MCFELDARPPLPPMRGAAVDAGELTLTSGDGTRFAAYGARSDPPSDVGVVIIPDVRGLHPYYIELAVRFAEAGVNAVGVDLLARTAGASLRDASFDAAPHVAAVRAETIDLDVAAAVAHLRGVIGPAGHIFTAGFCFGGRISFTQAAAGLDLAGVIGFYGWPVGESRGGVPAPAEMADRFTCPVLAIFGVADRGIGEDARAAFDRALERAGVEHRTVIYPGAPHSFFDRHAARFADASADAWRQVLDFMGVGSIGAAPA